MRAIVVDDNQILCETLTCFLEAEGFCVRGFLDPHAALAYCAVHDVDVMIVDVRMPTMDGLDFVARVKRRQQWVRVVVVTGNFLDAMRVARAVARHRVDGALEKPFDLASLVDSIFRSFPSKEEKAFVAPVG